MKSRISKLFQISVLLVAGVFTFATTGYVFANSYEVITLNDIPSVPSVTKFEVQWVKERYEKRVEIPNYRFDDLYIPNTKTRISLSKAWQIDNEIYQLASKGHYFFSSTDPVHEVGDATIYISKSWRTIYSPEKIKVNDTLKITNDLKTLTYKVIQVTSKHSSESHTLANDPRVNLDLVIYDKENSYTYYINSILVADENNI